MNSADAIYFRIDPQQPSFKVSRNFILSEYASKCGSFQVVLHPALILGVQRIRDEIGEPIKITSGYRTIGHNARIGGAPNSYHTLGMACDLTYDGDLKRIQAIATGIGMVSRIYPDRNFIHVDVGTPRTW
jgi:uncharacterized protein YcbK (DUF882 family)